MHDTSWRILQIHLLNVMLQRAVMPQRSQREQLGHGPFSANIQHRAMRLGWMMYHEKFNRSLCSMSCFSEQSCLSDYQGKKLRHGLFSATIQHRAVKLGWMIHSEEYYRPLCSMSCFDEQSRLSDHEEKNFDMDVSQEPYNLEQWNLGGWYMMKSTTDPCAQCHATLNSRASVIAERKTSTWTFLSNHTT